MARFNRRRDKPPRRPRDFNRLSQLCSLQELPLPLLLFFRWQLHKNMGGGVDCPSGEMVTACKADVGVGAVFLAFRSLRALKRSRLNARLDFVQSHIVQE